VLDLLASDSLSGFSIPLDKIFRSDQNFGLRQPLAGGAVLHLGLPVKLGPLSGSLHKAPPSGNNSK